MWNITEQEVITIYISYCRMIDIHNMKYRLTLGMYNTMDCESFWNNYFIIQ